MNLPIKTERLPRVGEKSQDGILLLEEEKIIYANDSFLMITGKKQSDVLGKSLLSCFDFTRQKENADFANRPFAADSQPLRFKVSLPAKAKKPREMEVSVSPMHGGNGKVSLVIVSDCPEEKRPSRNEPETEPAAGVQQSFQKWSELCNDAMVLHTQNGKVIKLNDEAQKLFQAKGNRFGKDNINVLFDKLKPQKLEEIRLENAGAKKIRFETGLKTTSGVSAPVEINTYVFNPEKKIYISVARDISPWKQKEAVLSGKVDVFKTLAEVALDAILYLDEQGKVVYWNPGAEKVFHYSHDEMVGKDFREYCVPARYAKEFSAAFLTFQKTGQGTLIGNSREMNAVNKEGEEFPIEVSVGAFRRKNKWHAVAIVRDITERIKIKNKMQETNENLVKALQRLEKTQKVMIRQEKLASLGLLSAGVAHEIKNPLNIISVGIQLLQLEENIPVEVKESYNTIMAQVHRIVKITDNLRDFARERKPEASVIYLDEFLEKTVALLEYEIKLENIILNKKYKKNDFSIHADEDQLGQVVLNILRNAWDSLREQKDTLQDKKSGEPWKGEISIETIAQGNMVQIVFSDTGTGIEKKELGKIFDPFYTTKDSTLGTGLGLSISYGIIQNHGGAIEVKSEPGKGTTFIVSLPAKYSGETG